MARLSDADRLFEGRIPSEDVPPELRHVAALVHAARAAATPSELGGQDHLVAEIAAAVRTAQPGGSGVARRRVLGTHSAKVVALATATVIVLGGGVAAAATGAFPAGIQRAIAHGLAHVGISLPDPSPTRQPAASLTLHATTTTTATAAITTTTLAKTTVLPSGTPVSSSSARAASGAVHHSACVPGSSAWRASSSLLTPAATFSSAQALRRCEAATSSAKHKIVKHANSRRLHPKATAPAAASTSGQPPRRGAHGTPGGSLPGRGREQTAHKAVRPEHSVPRDHPTTTVPPVVSTHPSTPGHHAASSVPTRRPARGTGHSGTTAPSAQPHPGGAHRGGLGATGGRAGNGHRPTGPTAPVATHPSPTPRTFASNATTTTSFPRPTARTSTTTTSAETTRRRGPGKGRGAGNGPALAGKEGSPHSSNHHAQSNPARTH